MEFEEWISQDDSALRLTDNTFTQSVYPVCAKCRDGIRQNLKDLVEQAEEQEWQRRVALRIGIGGFLICALVFAIAILTSK